MVRDPFVIHDGTHIGMHICLQDSHHGWVGVSSHTSSSFHTLNLSTEQQPVVKIISESFSRIIVFVVNKRTFKGILTFLGQLPSDFLGQSLSGVWAKGRNTQPPGQKVVQSGVKGLLYKWDRPFLYNRGGVVSLDSWCPPPPKKPACFEPVDSIWKIEGSRP